MIFKLLLAEFEDLVVLNSARHHLLLLAEVLLSVLELGESDEAAVREAGLHGNGRDDACDRAGERVGQTRWRRVDRPSWRAPASTRCSAPGRSSGRSRSASRTS